MKKYTIYNDNELLHLLSENDEKAFNEIYSRYWKTVYAVGFSRLKNAQLAEDVLHDVFASLWRNRARLEITSLQNYLASASKYLVFAAIRKTSNEKRYRSLQPHTTPESVVENDLLYKQLYEFVSREIEALPERCRLVYKYRERGLSNREIALEMNISTKTVENQINKALHHLRFSMKKILQMFV